MVCERRQHNRLVRREMSKYRGREVRHTGDGFFITFDGPSRALYCAQAIRQSVEELAVEIRAGIHTGEVERSRTRLAAKPFIWPPGWFVDILWTPFLYTVRGIRPVPHEAGRSLHSPKMEVHK